MPDGYYYYYYYYYVATADSFGRLSARDTQVHDSSSYNV
jgi:hypothetical protein